MGTVPNVGGPRVPGTGAPKDEIPPGFPGTGDGVSGPPAPGQQPIPNAGGGKCPPGQVEHCWPPPCRCEAPDALSKAGQDTCDETTHPSPKECYWCDFDTQQWVRGFCPQDGGGGGGGGGARGGAAAGGAKGGAYGAGGFPSTPYELALAAVMGQLSDTLTKFAGDVYGVGFPAYASGVDYYQTLLGRGGRGRMQAVTAPAAEQIQQGTEGAVKALGQGYLRGGARDEAEAQARIQGSGDIARLTQGVQPGAADRLIQAGGSGIETAMQATGSAAGIYGNLANLAVSSRLTSSGQALQAELGLKGLQLQRDLGFAGLDLQYSQLAASMAQFEKSFGLQSALGFGGLQLSYDQLAQQGSQFQQQLLSDQKIARQQSQAALGQGIGSMFGTLGAAAVAKSAAAYKTDIKEGAPKEEALRRIVEEAAPALRSWRYKPGILEGAYDHVFDNAVVLDLAPRYGVAPDAEHPGGKLLNIPQLLGDLVGAVAKLAEENAQLRQQVRALAGEEV